MPEVIGGMNPDSRLVATSLGTWTLGEAVVVADTASEPEEERKAVEKEK